MLAGASGALWPVLAQPGVAAAGPLASPETVTAGGSGVSKCINGSAGGGPAVSTMLFPAS